MTPARSHTYVAGHIGGKPENLPGSSSPVRFGRMPQDPPAQCLFLVSFSITLTSLVLKGYIINCEDKFKKRKAVLSPYLHS